MFRGIASDDFEPFGRFELLLPPVPEKPKDLGEVHLFTGVNGTGKTRILTLLAAMLGEESALRRRLKGSSIKVFQVTLSTPVPPRNQWTMFQAAENAVNWVTNAQNVANILQNTPAFAYSGNPYVSDAQVSVLADIGRPHRNVCLFFSQPEATSQVLLQAITNLKIASALDADESIVGQSRASNPSMLVKALESSITHITGLPFMFQVTRFPKLSIGVRWGGNALPFDVLPDGLRSIIGWLVHALVMMEIWVQGKTDPMQAKAIFLMDEIESHLHPAWQRKILPAFQRLFPQAQIILATHSPFVIASLNHGWIHPLTLSSDGKAKFEEPISASSGDSYVSVVEDIMGLKEWFDPETELLIADFRKAREQAYQRNAGAETRARELAAKIATRSVELEYMMGRELLQMDRQLAKSPGK